jgi:hypothetical protein
MKNAEYSEILQILSELKTDLVEKRNLPLDEWIPRKQVMKFLGYGDTQMGELERHKEIVFSRVGNRKFFKRDALLEFLESKIVK